MMDLIINLTTEFCAAHRIVGYKGECSRLHGHTWKVNIQASGDRSMRDEIGMLIDFKVLKGLVNEFDHKVILEDCKENTALIEVLNQIDQSNVFLLPSNPTAENLAMYLWKLCNKLEGLLRYKIIVWESDSSYASVGDISGDVNRW